ncbi:MAG: 2-keto-4-pentenoate hydratase [Candidatus Methylomirabilales bacterium]
MGSNLDLKGLAADLMAAYSNRTIVAAPSSRDANFDMTDAYAVEAELVRLRRAAGRTTTGLKVGYANKAMWRVLKLETLVWAHMYDDTVRFSTGNTASLSIGRMVAPKIEPEIVFKLKQPIAGTDPAAILAGVEWLAPGFEIIDCVFPDWEFQPADFVASFGLHAALVVGEPRYVEPAMIPGIAEQLPKFKLRLIRNGELVEEGSGRNSLRSPALCLGELARVATMSRGDLVSSGTLTTPTLIGAGEEWKAEVESLDLPGLTLSLSD